jgi:hypothetical protein
MLFLFVLKNAGAFWSAKVPKALCQSSNVTPHSPHTSKKQRALRFVFNLRKGFK